MGYSKKHQVDGILDSEGKKWVIVGFTMCAPLRSISTSSIEDCEDDNEPGSTTPTSKESRLPERLACPPAPRKRRVPSTCQKKATREFFTPPDLESVFIRRHK